MDPKKEQWKEEILNSLENMQPADPNPFLFAKIQHKLEEQGRQASQTFISKPLMTLAFTAIVFLISLNFFAISQLNNQDYSSTHTVESESSYSIVAQDYLNIYEDEASFTF